MLHRVFSRVSEDVLLVVLIVALAPLLWWLPEQLSALPGLVHWHTIAALAGLMVLSRGLEDSGYMAEGGRWLLTHSHGERGLAMALVLFSAVLSAIVTNDVALFIVVPLTLGLRSRATLPVGRLVIFEAMAVNAGSSISPAGNPQNLFLWQSSGVTFVDFALSVLPLGAGLVLLILAAVPLAFPRKRINVTEANLMPPLRRRLLWLSLALYPTFLILIDWGLAVPAAIGVTLLYLTVSRRLLLGVDWVLLVVFILMFVDLGLLALLPTVARIAGDAGTLPGGMLTTAILLSQFLSNVPAAIFLQGFTDDWQALAWGVNVGGFGIAIGSMANIIALRLARQPGLWREFHLWSLPMLLAASALAAALLACLRQPA